MEGAMKQRIHNKGLDSVGDRIGMKTNRAGFDVARLGKYTKQYERRKENGGKIGGRVYAGSGDNIYPINLQLHGDLMKDFTVGIDDGRSVLHFQSELSPKIVEKQEKNYNTVIYKPSENEKEGFKDVLLEGVGEVFKKYLKQ